MLVTLDTTRADRLGCYGYERDTSPHLDALANHAWLYTEAYSTSPGPPAIAFWQQTTIRIPTRSRRSALYDAEIASMDQELGRALNTKASRSQPGNTSSLQGQSRKLEESQQASPRSSRLVRYARVLNLAFRTTQKYEPFHRIPNPNA